MRMHSLDARFLASISGCCHGTNVVAGMQLRAWNSGMQYLVGQEGYSISEPLISSS